MAGSALTSIIVGVFDLKPYVHLQMVPHISVQHQYWRLFAHHFAFSNSSDLLVCEVLLFNTAIHVERQFGSVKFASFAAIVLVLSSLLEFVALLAFHMLGLTGEYQLGVRQAIGGFNVILGGPTTLVFAILYQYSRIVPAMYKFRIFGAPLNNKSFMYMLALQLAFSRTPGSLLPAVIGLSVGQLYRSDLTNLKHYRLPPRLVGLGKRLRPLVGSLRAPRRALHVIPEDTNNSRMAGEIPRADLTTARTQRPSGRASGDTNHAEDATGFGAEGRAAVMREWVQELASGAPTASAAGVRIPAESEVAQLTSMFPDLDRAVIVAALQRSSNIEGAVETLLNAS
ncbi:hypothetical protein FISHEDRAFT_57542 [Fistulina hepatica ATCC 64428]|uniref:CUE domain-containing protein n=1 Tax=Fistulina hepatica ATCC 64428 TaxID=1128425 RepID=A0A0D7AFL4_9AGAR|nr:hypothetical protein FISHEDRAFT_57542 [Fistulina hepatica ATCC 64428]